MNISVDVKPVRNKKANDLVAFASLTFEDYGIIISSIRVFNSDDKFLVVFPERKKEGKRFNVVFPLNPEKRMFMINTIIEKYKEEVESFE